MNCRDCSRYDLIHRSCLDGKVNPERYETAVQVANVMGPRAICPLNDFRERILNARGQTVRLAPSVRRPPNS